MRGKPRVASDSYRPIAALQEGQLTAKSGQSCSVLADNRLRPEGIYEA